jgi:hypothetical protein
MMIGNEPLEVPAEKISIERHKGFVRRLLSKNAGKDLQT